jgi:hypothetical protein
MPEVKSLITLPEDFDRSRFEDLIKRDALEVHEIDRNHNASMSSRLHTLFFIISVQYTLRHLNYMCLYRVSISFHSQPLDIRRFFLYSFML